MLEFEVKVWQKKIADLEEQLIALERERAEHLAAAVAEAVLAERQACVAIAENYCNALSQYSPVPARGAARAIAEAIRARGNGA